MKAGTLFYYLYHGSWMDLYEELCEMLKSSEEEKFAICDPNDKMRGHCVILVEGMPLADSYCYQRNIWKTDENVFQHFYLSHINEFTIYGYEEILEMTFQKNKVE